MGVYVVRVCVCVRSECVCDVLCDGTHGRACVEKYTIPSPLLSYTIISVVLAWWAIATMQRARAVSISAQLTDCMQDRSYLKHGIYYY